MSFFKKLKGLKKAYDGARDAGLIGGKDDKKKSRGESSGGGAITIPGLDIDIPISVVSNIIGLASGGGGSGSGSKSGIFGLIGKFADIPGLTGGGEKKSPKGGFSFPGGFTIPGGIKMPSFFGKRSYHKGWSPHSSKSNKFQSTIRDIGKGSATHSDYAPMGVQQVTTMYDDVKANCLAEGSLWEDPDFPAADSSIYYQNPPSVWPNIEWLRPHEICSDPQMFVEGASRLDINQGVLGDCWLLAGIAGLATNQKLLHRVVPNGQSFEDGNYAGIFKFEIWQYGRWVEVLIDDRLPTTNGKLIYMHSDERNEFWTALLEKAYAKLHGNYEALSGGLTSEAMTDFTGGLVERFQLRDQAPEDLFKMMSRAKQRGSLMGCSIDASPDQMEARLDNGLIIGHAYTITDVRSIDCSYGSIPMIRVRNPWGDEHEWQGPWSDNSDEWNMIPEEERQSMGLAFDFDGEFWMAFDDWVNEFQRLEVCYLGPDTLVEDDDDGIRKWEGKLMEGGWKRRVNAGGCRNYPSTFWTNPQYRVHIEEGDEDDEDGMQSVIIAVMQKERRKLRSEGKSDMTIGYAVYGLEDGHSGPLDYRYFQSHASDARSPAFINLREISDHHRLPPGDYVIVPSTFEPNEEADFIVRVYSMVKDDINEIDEDTSVIPDGADDDIEEATEEEQQQLDECETQFNEVAGEDEEISAYELRDLLNETYTQEFEFDGFSIDLCRSMVAMCDSDLSGKLGLKDFRDLWDDLSLCKRAFKTMDVDGNGYFNSYEFRLVLNKLGLKVRNSTFNAIVMRYSDNDGHVRFDDFVACVVKLKSMFATYRENDPRNEGQATFQMDEFIQMTMYS